MSRTYKHIRKWKTNKFWDEHRENRPKFFKTYKIYGYNDGQFIETGTVERYVSVTTTASPYKVLDFIKRNRCYKNTYQLQYDYSGAPSWWTKLYMIRPSRRKEKTLEKQAMKFGLDSDNLIFPLARKPFIYYW